MEWGNENGEAAAHADIRPERNNGMKEREPS